MEQDIIDRLLGKLPPVSTWFSDKKATEVTQKTKSLTGASSATEAGLAGGVAQRSHVSSDDRGDERSYLANEMQTEVAPDQDPLSVVVGEEKKEPSKKDDRTYAVVDTSVKT